VRWVGDAACMGETRNLCRILVVNFGETTPLIRARHRWEDNIKMYLKWV
jgi:hypothetical protein